MTDIEIIKCIAQLNDELYTKYGESSINIEYSTNGIHSVITFLTIELWSDQDDTRIYSELNQEYEELDACLRRQLHTTIKSISRLIL